MPEPTKLNILLLIALILVLNIIVIGIYMLWKKRSDRSKRIKVLSKGKKEPTWYHTECTHCGAELEFSSEHIQESNVPAESFFDLDESQYIICPLCGKKIGVAYSKREICKY